MVMYADIVFVTNAVIDYTLLVATGTVCRQPMHRGRLLLASFIGAAYTVFLFFPPLSFAFTFIAKWLFSCLMLFIAFGWTNAWTMLRLLAALYGASFFIGGGLFALHYYMEQQSEIVNGIVVTHTGRQPALWLLVLGFPALWWGVRSGYRALKASRQTDVQHVRLEIELFTHTVACTGFIDTGNRLHDPLSRAPVTITELAVWNEVIPEALMAQIEAGMPDTGQLSDEEYRWFERIRFIPYRTVSSETSLLVALRPDTVRVYTESDIYQPEGMLIGLRPGTLSSGGTYQAIVHPQAFAGEHHLAS
ncbi:stage II sporulation protein GA (sporulation sigma-E factor processing peptidase) [Aneurinibacillus soli]|uniref:Sporulation sigma-E factor-processing peptidase n=1 Tax=Aneurinibacillus soli TaxID=1500254 RepID=A0A0U5B9A1_9BACL|nr:sigma-E processing peptidase SpoIIGA [Aneurinibacillus soli]PYE63567.1 stage II sporulation protein GA (sporulation sigma-E factor processing peptidase) [Aneurinibacillus soli]BAU27500.1 Sporulation factor SpoIIGA [Aneurinibacillus soli]